MYTSPAYTEPLAQLSKSIATDPMTSPVLLPPTGVGLVPVTVAVIAVIGRVVAGGRVKAAPATRVLKTSRFTMGSTAGSSFQVKPATDASDAFGATRAFDRAKKTETEMNFMMEDVGCSEV